MPHEIEAGTDTSALLLFDPGAIPSDVDRRLLDAGSESLNRLDRAGLVCLIRTAGDGVFLLHLYVDERVPERLLAFATHPRRFRAFPVPSGRLCFAGLEYALREDSALLRQHPRPGGSMALAPGTYKLSLYQFAYPERLVHQAFRTEAPAPEYLAWISMKLLIPLAVAAWIGLVAIFFTNVRVPFPPFAAPLLGLVFALPFVVRRLDVYVAALDRFASLQRGYPSLAAVLESSRSQDESIIRAAAT
jgi:hypothetical protein